MNAIVQYYGTGRRKSSVARVYLRPGTGNILVNKIPLAQYFGRSTLQMMVRQPLELTENSDQFDIFINVSGGGVTASAKNKKEAIRFLEFLTSAKSQETFGKVNYEYPVVIKDNQSDLLKSWGAFKADKVNLSLLGAKNAEAVKLFDLAVWE